MKSTLETRLGLFFALALIAAVILLEISGGMDTFRRGYQLHALFNSVQELQVGAPVKLAGVPVGTVKQIDIAENGTQIKVTMKIDARRSIKTDAKASIRFAGLMGQNFIAINLGSAPTSFNPDQQIQTTEQADFAAIMAKLESVASGVENVTKSFSGDSIQNILGPFTDFLKDNRKNMTLMIGNMQSISQQALEGKGTLGKLINDDSLYTNAVESVKKLNATADDVKLALDDARGMIADARGAVTDAKGALGEARTMISQVNEGKGTVGKLLKDETLINETTLAMSNLREILQKINTGQGSVGKMVNDESLFKNVKMTLQKVEKATEGLEDQGPLSVLGLAVGKLF